MNQLVKPERQAVIDPVPVLDSSLFEHMQRVASVMAKSSLVPDALCKVKQGGQMVELPPEQVFANCFLVVNQAVRWGLDPFGVAQCVSVVHGKLCYEGKLVAAVLEAKLAVRLHHHFTGDPKTDDYRIYLCDQPFTPELIAQLKPGVSIPGFRLIDGSVGEWKTTGNNSPWSPKNYFRMLIYRGTRDWTRIYESALMLGVYTQDEMLDLADNARALRARDITKPSLAERLAAANQGGVETALLRAAEAVDEETGEVTETKENSEVQSAERSVAHTEADKSPDDRNRGDVGQVAAGETAGSDAGATGDAGAANPSSSEPSTSTAQTGGEQPGSAQPAAAASAPPPADAAPNPGGGSMTQEQAYALGRKFKVEGKLKKACPKDIRADDDLFEAFITGYDETPDE